MDVVLRGLIDFAVPYLDVALLLNDWESHIRHLKTELDRLSKTELTVKSGKCQIGRAHVKYLGNEIGQGTRRSLEEKITAGQSFPKPKTKTHLRAFFVLTGYYNHIHTQLAS